VPLSGSLEPRKHAVAQDHAPRAANPLIMSALLAAAASAAASLQIAVSAPIARRMRAGRFADHEGAGASDLCGADGRAVLRREGGPIPSRSKQHPPFRNAVSRLRRLDLRPRRS